jgi:hypothetical protein
MIDSLVNEIPYQSFTASVTNSINLLNAFTQSQQPTFNALNSFTASQLTLNTGYNQATSSLATSIAVVSSEVNQLQIWTSSVNEISFNSQIPQYATRWNFGGFISASFVPNVNGLIADINVLNDPSKLNTSSFNAYTASTNSSLDNLNAFTASQTNWNASATASIVQLLSFSSSLDATYATDAQLAAVSASLNNSINTKLDTSSFNSFTQSVATAGYATTGSNTFVGNQTINNGFSLTLATLKSATSAGMIISSSGGLGIARLGAGGGQQAEFLGQVTAVGAMSASSFTGLGNLTTYSTSVDTRLDNLEILTASFATTGSNDFKATQIITGSVRGNVNALSITSNTASMDLSLSNFFTLSLVSGSSTHLTATNIRPGQTINLLITQSNPASGSLTYNSTIKFPAGNGYVATQASASKDIITFITFDSSTIYAAAINNLV